MRREQTINGIRLSYEWLPCPGSTRTIVLLHGFLSSSFSFRKLIPSLRGHFSVLTIDWPPFGYTERPRYYTYSYENTAKTLASFIQQMISEPVTLTGHSMGGQLVLQILKHSPSLADQAILLCASGYIPRAKGRLIAASYLPFADFFVKRWLEKSGVEGNLRRVVFDQAMIDEEMIQGYSHPFETRAIFKGLARFLRHREDDLTSEELQKLQTPCLLIWGEHDRIVPLSVGTRLAADLPNSRIKIIKKAGHLLPEEKPEETARLMKQFISQS